jgi:hypothetical protein
MRTPLPKICSWYASQGGVVGVSDARILDVQPGLAENPKSAPRPDRPLGRAIKSAKEFFISNWYKKRYIGTWGEVLVAGVACEIVLGRVVSTISF